MGRIGVGGGVGVRLPPRLLMILSRTLHLIGRPPPPLFNKNSKVAVTYYLRKVGLVLVEEIWKSTTHRQRYQRKKIDIQENSFVPQIGFTDGTL